jgi:nitrous oxidase accessory protein NosD
MCGCGGAARAAEQSAEWKGLQAVWYSNWGAFLAIPDDNLRREMPADDISMLVVGIAQGSAAEAANLARGDWIVRKPEGFAQVGAADSIVIERGGERYAVTIKTREHEFGTAALASPGAPRATPRTLIVAPDGRDGHRTITRALSLARPGDTVSVRDGLYREQLVIPHQVTLEVAEGAAAYVEAPSPLRLFGVEGSAIRRLNLNGLGQASTIYASAAKHVRFEDLTASRDTPGSIVGLSRSSDVDMTRCSLLGANQVDGVVATASEVRVIGCSIMQCSSGIMARDGSRIQADDNVMEGNFHGIRVFGSRVTAANNTITGIDAKSGGGLVAVDAEVSIRSNVVRRQDSGFFGTNARGTVQDSTFAQCRIGMLVNSPGLEITGNRIASNGSTGIFLDAAKDADKNADNASSRTVVASNTIAFNGSSGVMVSKHAAEISGNVLEANNAGVWLAEGPADITHNTIVLQRFAGIICDAPAHGVVANNIVALGNVGMHVDARSPCRFESNVVYGHFGSKTFPPIDLNYVRVDRLRLSDGNLLPVSVFPALDLPGKADLQVDPKFVKVGADYHLAADSPLCGVKGSDGKIIGALPATE